MRGRAEGGGRVEGHCHVSVVLFAPISSHIPYRLPHLYTTHDSDTLSITDNCMTWPTCPWRASHLSCKSQNRGHGLHDHCQVAIPPKQSLEANEGT